MPTKAVLTRQLIEARLSRDSALRSIANIHTFAENARVDMSLITALNVRVRALDDLSNQFREQQLCVMQNLIELNRVDEYNETDVPLTVSMEAHFYEIRTIAAMLVPEVTVPTAGTRPPPTTGISLPKIELPKFNGDVINWRTFRDTFLSLVHENPSIGNIERFHYLLSCLSGSALVIMKSIPLSADNYNIAWNALLDRFDNKRLLATAHVDKLFAFKPMSVESLSSLNSFVNIFQDNIAALKVLGINDLAGFLLFYLGSRSLSSSTRQLYEASIATDTVPDFDSLLTFIQRRCKILENIQGGTQVDNVDKFVTKRGRPSYSSAKTSFTTAINFNKTPNKPSSSVRKCIFCLEPHPLYRCTGFKNETVKARREFVLSKKLCFSCLGNSHVVSACTSKSSCFTCGQRHHTLLHIVQDASLHVPVQSHDERSTPIDSGARFVGSTITNTTVILGTAIIRVQDNFGHFHSVRVLLDSGSQVSAVTAECVARLGLKKQNSHIDVVGLDQSPVARVKGITECRFVPNNRFEPSFHCHEMLVLPSISSLMPTESLPPIVREKYQHLQLADPFFDVPKRVDMLLGCDMFPLIVRPRGDILHHVGLPSAFDTYLGWIIVGTYIRTFSPSLTSLATASLHPVDVLLRQFWTIEEPPAPNIPTTDGQKCEDWFQKTMLRDASGRFTVALPFRDPAPSDASSLHGLGESRSLALKRLFNLERRLVKDPSLYDEYRKFMNTYLSLGHMRHTIQPGKYYIPHHAVFKAGEDVSKLRVVFDASARTTSGLSLNDVLFTGPKLQTDISDIILKSRLKAFIFTADITKMYRQIRVQDEDCAYQHILWRQAPADEVQEFELTTVTYGVSSAPFLAIRCLRELDLQEGPRFPAARGLLSEMTYVDDIIGGADTPEELMTIQDDIVALLRAGGCELKKWTSNCQQVLERVPPEDRVQSLVFDPKDDHTVKVLGLHWDPRMDLFKYHTHVQECQFTKRKVLSTIARLFDPVGLLGPLLLWAKAFMQQLWLANLDWDTPLPNALAASWQQFVTDLPALRQLSLPRHIDVRHPQVIQLLGFSDASMKGYAANVYLRVVHNSGDISIHFLTCKTKVAPTSIGDLNASVSIPRLELCAALLVTKMLHHIHKVLSTKISISKVRAWSDSTVVLSWLKSSQTDFKIFVTNRVAKIHSLLPECQWDYVSSSHNPADPASRGLLPLQTISCDLHHSGPTFLYSPDSQWPVSSYLPIQSALLPERKTASTIALLVADDEEVPDIILLRFSSLTKMQRTLALCLRFVSKLCHHDAIQGIIQLTELDKVLHLAVKLTQHRYFSALIKQLNGSGKIITPPSMAQLSPFIDTNGIVRVGGRLRLSNLDPDAKHPILLPKGSHLTCLVIRHYHETFLHSGAQLTLSMIRRKFWVLSGRDSVRQFIFSCVRCVRHKAQRPQPIMGNLPTGRVQQHFPFSHVGMDYGGPFTVKENRRRNARTTKMYLALFVCMSVKAVHLELVTDLSTQAFLAAMDRFVARRGIPSDIYSDCGTNYIGAARQIKELFRTVETQQTLSVRIPCRWHFNPPAAPHFGGIWEAGIKSTKLHLRRVIGDQVLTVEEMQTLVTRVEGILNSRPLSPSSNDPSDMCALTPGHFIIGRPIMSLPERDVTQVPMNRLDRWSLIRQCHQSFWKRWSTEYLQTLQTRSKWFHQSPNLQVGDLVIVEAPNRPPAEWGMGRVLECHPGQDDVVRVVTIQTKHGTLKRPVVKLVRLPVCDVPPPIPPA